MIVVTRFNGPQLAINADLIERAEATPDTILTLVDGTKYVVCESVEEIIELVRQFRATVLLTAKQLEDDAGIAPSHLVPGHSASGHSGSGHSGSGHSGSGHSGSGQGQLQKYGHGSASSHSSSNGAVLRALPTPSGEA